MHPKNVYFISSEKSIYRIAKKLLLNVYQYSFIILLSFEFCSNLSKEERKELHFMAKGVLVKMQHEVQKIGSISFVSNRQ